LPSWSLAAFLFGEITATRSALGDEIASPALSFSLSFLSPGYGRVDAGRLLLIAVAVGIRRLQIVQEDKKEREKDRAGLAISSPSAPRRPLFAKEKAASDQLAIERRDRPLRARSAGKSLPECAL